jgi:hypothetical protein
MHYYKATTHQQLSFKRYYGIIAFFLLIAFAGRVSIICINGGPHATKFQQLLTEDNQEQNDKHDESKFDNKQLTEFISPVYADMQLLPVTTLAAGYRVSLSLFIKMPLITIITPPPDFLLV